MWTSILLELAVAGNFLEKTQVYLKFSGILSPFWVNLRRKVKIERGVNWQNHEECISSKFCSNGRSKNHRKLDEVPRKLCRRHFLKTFVSQEIHLWKSCHWRSIRYYHYFLTVTDFKWEIYKCLTKSELCNHRQKADFGNLDSSKHNSGRVLIHAVHWKHCLLRQFLLVNAKDLKINVHPRSFGIDEIKRC